MAKSGKKWQKMAKIKQKVTKIEAKSGKKWQKVKQKVAKSGKKRQKVKGKVAKSGKKWQKNASFIFQCVKNGVWR